MQACDVRHCLVAKAVVALQTILLMTAYAFPFALASGHLAVEGSQAPLIPNWRHDEQQCLLNKHTRSSPLLQGFCKQPWPALGGP